MNSHIYCLRSAKFYCVASIVSLFYVGCRGITPPEDSFRAQHRTTVEEMEIHRLLMIVQDKTSGSADRISAIQELGELGDLEAAKELASFLPGDFDEFTFYVVIAVGKIGDQSLIPKLREIRDAPIHGIGALAAEADFAIRRIEARGGACPTH